MTVVPTTGLSEELAPWLRAIFDTGAEPVDVLDDDPGADNPIRPLIWVTAGGTALAGRTVDGGARVLSDVARCVCVSYSAKAAERLALDLAVLVDGSRLSGDLLRMTMKSAPIEAREDPSTYRWSVTVDVTRHSGRAAR